MSYSKGIMWLDDCRIPIGENDDPRISKEYKWGQKPNPFGEAVVKVIGDGWNTQGRFTPNLLVCDDMLNDGNIVQYNKTRKDNGSYLGGHREEFVGTENNPIVNKVKGQFFNDKGSNSRYYDLDLWFDKMIERL